jgi:hypothetical protein
VRSDRSVHFEGLSHARYDWGKPCYALTTEINITCQIYNISIYSLQNPSLCSCSNSSSYPNVLGRAIAKAVTRRLSTTAARVQAQVRSCGDLWWTKWHWGRFSPSTSVSPANSHSTDCSTFVIIYHPGLITIGQLVDDVPSGLRLTPPEETKKNKKQPNAFADHSGRGLRH